MIIKMKATNKNSNGTSFHSVAIKTTPSNLINLAKKFNAEFCDQNDGTDKVNYDFEFETDDGDVFTIYDWKEYQPLKLENEYVFHIGGFNVESCLTAKSELKKELKHK